MFIWLCLIFRIGFAKVILFFETQHFLRTNFENFLFFLNFPTINEAVFDLDAQLKSWLKMSLSVTYSDTKDDLKLADSDEGLIGYSLTTIPSIPIYNVDGSYSSVSQEGFLQLGTAMEVILTQGSTAQPRNDLTFLDTLPRLLYTEQGHRRSVPLCPRNYSET